MPDPKEDPLAQNAAKIRDAIDNLHKTSFNPASSLNSELRALALAATSVPIWMGRIGAKEDLRSTAMLTLNQVSETLKAIRELRHTVLA